ncbi:unnamed protein product [Heligmosomoides polygyrus]|uniref:Uncharacterized protein n=1 Tax=Heligmosomoides polygyrus TaxID=6339 RepID=A0A183F8C0_HELPZ|nr:unnamed protein product [Heligmosomoides polygyrus]
MLRLRRQPALPVHRRRGRQSLQSSRPSHRRQKRHGSRNRPPERLRLLRVRRRCRCRECGQHIQWDGLQWPLASSEPRKQGLISSLSSSCIHRLIRMT